MEHTVFQISELIGKERFGTLSEEENEVLEEWRRQSAEHETLYQKLQDTRYLSESVARLSGIDTRQPLLHMQRQIAGFTRRRQVLRLRQIVGVAALFLILLGSFWLVHRQSSLRQPPVVGLRNPDLSLCASVCTRADLTNNFSAVSVASVAHRCQRRKDCICIKITFHRTLCDLLV